MPRGPAETVEALYQQALEDLDDGLYPEALKGFNEVKTKYPYSKYAALADLRAADTHFERGKFLEAVDAYRHFIKFHPNHAEAPYAMLRISESYFEQIPEDWWFMPPSAEKDQAHTRLAISAYRDMLARFPKSELAPRATDRLAECRLKLANHEMYVARFYFKRDKYRAAAARAEGLLKNYTGLSLDAEALWMAAQARYYDGDVETAKQHLTRLTKDFAQSDWAADAARLLAKLGPGSSAVTEKDGQKG